MYSYNRIVCCISQDISQEVIEDPVLDKMWKAALQDKCYQKVAVRIEGKADVESMKTLSCPPVKELVGHGIERMCLIRKYGIMMDHNMIVVPMAMREVLLKREHISYSGQTKMSNSIRMKYFWPGIEGDVKRTVEACLACQMHGAT